jgi:hypothetical protein
VAAGWPRSMRMRWPTGEMLGWSMGGGIRRCGLGDVLALGHLSVSSAWGLRVRMIVIISGISMEVITTAVVSLSLQA